MSNDGGSPEKCREARRRRMEMRRVGALPGDAQPPQPGSPSRAEKRREKSVGEGEGGKRSRTVGPHASPRPPLLLLNPSLSSSSCSSSSSQSASSSGGPEAPLPDAPAGPSAVDPPPVFGSVSLSGRSREMEDAVSLQPGFFSPGADGASPLHFFAVFDGHGGTHVSALCRERMHVLLAEELRRVSSEGVGGGQITEEGLTAATVRCFRRMDELALASCACGSVGEPPCGCEQAGLLSQIVGSTAVVAVVGRDRVLVANCGDSRAVLSRGGRAVPLSSDHKPDRPDELARIEAAGGRVIYVNGARVLGILAMSRALGDKYLKPVVISEPEISFTERTPDDEFLIIASDGLWDVLSNDLACDIARRCLQDGSQPAIAGGLGEDGDRVVEPDASQSYCSVAATLLTRLALGRNSTDNISVIVVDLRRR
uniref:protein-serine/threonine phosphatase n=1 Tax=Anthurium amnicola TaxID=1678845 RepID=A0A1D1Z664_9ARAE